MIFHFPITSFLLYVQSIILYFHGVWFLPNLNLFIYIFPFSNSSSHNVRELLGRYKENVFWAWRIVCVLYEGAGCFTLPHTFISISLCLYWHRWVWTRLIKWRSKATELRQQIKHVTNRCFIVWKPLGIVRPDFSLPGTVRVHKLTI